MPIQLPHNPFRISGLFVTGLMMLMCVGCQTVPGPESISKTTQPAAIRPGLPRPDQNRYELDPVHTRIMFAIDHAGFSKAIGTVSGISGVLYFDSQDWRSAHLEVTVPLNRLDLGNATWNRASLAGNLLDIGKYPTAQFVSTRVEPIARDRASVHGVLTLHGVMKEIMLDVKLNALKRHPLPPFRRTIGFSATTQLSRKAFGIDAWPSVIGDTVELRIEVEAIRVGRDERDQTDVTNDALTLPAKTPKTPDKPSLESSTESTP